MADLTIGVQYILHYLLYL